MFYTFSSSSLRFLSSSMISPSEILGAAPITPLSKLTRAVAVTSFCTIDKSAFLKSFKLSWRSLNGMSQWQPVEQQGWFRPSWNSWWWLLWLRPPKNQPVSSLIAKLKSLDKALFSPRFCITNVQPFLCIRL